MPPNVTESGLSLRQEEVAQLLAEDRLTWDEIAARAGINRRTLARWKLQPEFQARVQAIRKEEEAAIMKRGIARRASRIQRLNERVSKLDQIIAARGADPERQEIPGYSTGLLVVRKADVVMVPEQVSEGEPPRSRPVAVPTEVAVDTGLLRELREHEKQAAIETGQWTEKHEHSIQDLDAAIRGELGRLAGIGQNATPGTPQGHPDPGAEGG